MQCTLVYSISIYFTLLPKVVLIYEGALFLKPSTKSSPYLSTHCPFRADGIVPISDITPFINTTIQNMYLQSIKMILPQKWRLTIPSGLYRSLVFPELFMGPKFQKAQKIVTQFHGLCCNHSFIISFIHLNRLIRTSVKPAFLSLNAYCKPLAPWAPDSSSSSGKPHNASEQAPVISFNY